MPRSRNGNDNVQFVQELAEVDGPFESPININFRDLTKLELPALVWNRGEARPKKMKITNTGHTVIVSGKWKSERPYLTGGPLTGKYVFSQIHFHWGKDNVKGSEHQVCGESYPLEMHVAHFKTEYLTQECALREKDGMVVVVYLFKLQQEPNENLKKIIALLPCVKQAGTSYPIDPRPIFSLCNPFSEDYFMYWGSVVTPTCAHILLWVICREPLGISIDQVNEFRKIMDLAQQPIHRNSRDIQPLHKRNVFHVNASKYHDEALLPIRKILGCYCKGAKGTKGSKGSETNFDLSCTCQHSTQNQEEVEGGHTDRLIRHDRMSTEDTRAFNDKPSLTSGCFPNQTIVVQTATVHSVSIVLKRFGSDPVDHTSHDSLQPIKSQDDSQKLTSQSCCFFSVNDAHSVKEDKKKIRDRKRPFDSLKPFSQLLSSLEAIKAHTFKKLKEIESINQEIKGIKPLLRDVEEKRWLRRLEKIISDKKGFTINTSRGYLKELKKLAAECNFDKFFENKRFPEIDGDAKSAWLSPEEMTNGKRHSDPKKGELPMMHVDNDRIKFPGKAHKLLQNFFEDIQDADDLQEKVKKNFDTERTAKQAGDGNSISSLGKGYITKNLFKLGNLGDRFFTEVISEDPDLHKHRWEKENKKSSAKLLALEQLGREYQKITANESVAAKERSTASKRKSSIPLHRANVSVAISKAALNRSEILKNFYQHPYLAGYGTTFHRNLTGEERIIPNVEGWRRGLFRLNGRHWRSRNACQNVYSRKLLSRKNKELISLANERLMRMMATNTRGQDCEMSSSNLSSESRETQSMIIAKFRRGLSRKAFWPFKKSSARHTAKVYPKKRRKIRCKKFNVYYIDHENLKDKKNQKRKNWRTTSFSKDWKSLMLDSKIKTRKFKHQKESTGNTTTESDLEKPKSPERKKLRLEHKKALLHSPRAIKYFSDDDRTEEETTGSPRNISSGRQETKLATIEKENLKDELEVSKPPQRCFSKEQHSMKDPGPDDVSHKTPLSVASTKKVSIATTASQVLKTSPKSEIPSEENKVWLVPENKNLNDVTATPRTSTQSSQREIGDVGGKIVEEDLKLESPRQGAENNPVQSAENLMRGISNETCGKSVAGHDHGETARLSESKETRKLKYSAEFFTTSSQVDDEFLLRDKDQEGKAKNVLLKRCDAEKYTFLQKIPQRVNLPSKNPDDLFNEILFQTDSNKSFGLSKDDVDSMSMGNKDLRSPASYTALKNSAARSHSAETLNFLLRKLKQKYKKRPHCCKRNSIHYIMKNPSKKFEDAGSEEVSQENDNVTSQANPSSGVKDASQQEVPAAKPLEKETKTGCFESKKKINTSKFQAETKKEKKGAVAVKKPPADTPKSAPTTRNATTILKKPATAVEKPASAVKKPVNNFIKLNKQLAATYKRTKAPGERTTPTKPGLNKSQKQQPEKEQKRTSPRPQRLPVNKRGRIPIRKPDFQFQPVAQTLLTVQSKISKEKSPPKVELPEDSPSVGCLQFERLSDSQIFTCRKPFF